MTIQSWIIGSRPDCQLVVDQPAVSGEHCRLTVDGGLFLLEDLHSTNGTYVNGEKIDAPREVRFSDRITLGQSQPMPWPDELKPAAPKPLEKTMENPDRTSGETYSIAGQPARTDPARTVMTIGRGPHNSVVLNESNISTQHARLTVTADRIILEDLGSTNGTSVGTVENKIHRAEVHKGDTIFFGSAAYSLFDLIQKHNGVKPVPTARPASAPRPTEPVTPKSAGHLPQWITGSLATAAVLLVGWIIFGRSHANIPNQTAANGAAPAKVQVDSEGAAGVSAPPSIAEEERLARCLYVIVASDAERKTPFRVGTGFAVDARHIATTGSVIAALRHLQRNGYPQAFLYCPNSGAELEIAETRVHAGFQSADQAANSAQSEYESIMEQYEAEPPAPDKLDAVKTQLLSAQEKALLSFERKTTSDVAVLKTSQSLKYWLEGVKPGTALRPNLKLTVRGLAHDVEDPFFDPQSIGEPSAMESRVRQVTRISSNSPPRLLAEAGLQQRDYAWFGSPVLNARGQVVAVYSRPTPPMTEAEAADPSLTFDAPLFDRVRECLPENP